MREYEKKLLEKLLKWEIVYSAIYLFFISYLNVILLFLHTTDSGQYRCTARNERGEASLTMNLDISSKVSVGK